jgi:shikimate kinase
MNPASNLIFIGPTGAGKTSIGRRAARHFGLRFVDADREVEQRSGATIPLIFECEGEPGFRAREREVIRELCGQRDLLIATGAGAVLDAENRQAMAEGGFIVYLRISVEEQLRRLRRDRSRPLLQAPDRESRLRTMATQRNPIYETLADLRFHSGNQPQGRMMAQLFSAIEKQWQRPELT